jgi:hypothetical protein
MLGGVGYAGLARYFKNKEEERINDLLHRHRQRMQRKARRAGAEQEMTEARLDEVEADLGRTVLLAMTVNHLLQQKGVLTEAEIDWVAREVDVLDGIADGKLNPAVVRPKTAAKPMAKTPEEFLRQLEQEDD